MGARAVKLPISKLEVFSKFSNLIKYSLRRRIIFGLRCNILKIIIKLLKSNAFYIFFNDIFGAIYI